MSEEDTEEQRPKFEKKFTCEDCGEPGKIRPGGWIRTLCDAHHKERSK